MTRPRYYVKTSYHVWSVMRRADANMPNFVRPDSALDTAVDHIGARGRGDQAARTLARETVDKLNAKYDSCGFCHGEPVGNAAAWSDGKSYPPAECPRCGLTSSL